MKPQIKKVGSLKSQSFDIVEVNEPHFFSRWHYHPQCEIMYVLESSGTRIAGDSIKRFRPGEIVFIGPDLPHIWKNDDLYYRKNSRKNARAIVIYFSRDFLGKDMDNIPEMFDVRDLLNTAKQGMLFQGETRKKLAYLLKQSINADGLDRFLLLFNMLKVMAKSNEYQILSSRIFSSAINQKEFDRINIIYNYILEHFKNNIRLEEISKVSNMTPNAFCRYFKLRIGMTFVHFVNEVRVGYACKLLIESKMNITQICYESGFENFSNFIRQFKKIKGITPKTYRAQAIKQ
jgi:AraC-like DNA-binding protein